MSINYTHIPSPCFVLNEDLLRKNLALIKSVKDSTGVEIILAFKSFAMWGAFPVIREYIPSATASSLNEAQLAFEEMGSKAHTYAPAYTDGDFDKILPYSSHITFNSIGQFQRFKCKVLKHPEAISMGLRINPEHSTVKTDLYNPGIPGSRLGIPSSEMPELLPDGIEGLHFHSLCESNSYHLEKTLEAVEQKFGQFLPQIKWLNMGGGHLMTHKDYDIDHLISVLKAFKDKWGLHLILEPGSAFNWGTGVLASTVIDIVSNHGIKTAMLDVSFAAHMPDCLEMPYQPTIVNASIGAIKNKHVYKMGGNSCLAGDVMGDYSFEKELQVGNRIVFEDMIHYTMVKTTMFNGVTHPSIGIWSNKKGFTLLREFGYIDFKNRLG
ncbi:carboxynorspermidine decarboxylase [Saccharicrinis carchari]|uniref:Carboxynorspermidine/carboxyspermidine decarboxylase n=1 Tax=Saccharicrinis carchari TaxID=1168039 RepID=A0A521BFI3_SACCC|nr:carboxynorspermidine decarboxylase [Saccharicrinis carchari]SMO45832.1 carboxynorspermidine decarboxylase [Saccharicrinis carchari]